MDKEIINPKVLICIMSCNNELYKEEENIVINTYIKICNLIDNIDFVGGIKQVSSII